MKKARTNKQIKKGFTLVELLCVIVILGVISTMAIAGISNLISKSKEEKNNQNEKNVSMAVESYLQANKGERPHTIGQVERISLKKLRSTNFITSDIENSKGESCMENSYVRIYKYSTTGYTYTTYLYCGNEEAPAEETVPKPSGTVKFTDSKGNETTDALTNVGIARVIIELNGGNNNDGTPLAIDGYSYSISVKTQDDSDLREVFNSGTLSGNSRENIQIEELLKKYIDVTKDTKFNIKFSVRNVAGGEITSIVESDDTSAIYKDTVPPICENIREEAKEGDWITEEGTYRTISTTCNDSGKSQSECVRSYYSKSWPNSKERAAEYSWITIEDNAKNKNITTCEHGSAGCCKVRVNVDWDSPTVEIKAYKSNANGTPANNTNILSKKLIANTKEEEKYFINSNEYNNTTNNWFNKNDYPDGVVYSVKMSDNLNLAGYTWKTNNSLTGSGDTNVQNGSTDESILQENVFLDKALNGKEETIYIRFKYDGYRYGVLNVFDKAGNVTEIKIRANLDKVAPPTPTPKAPDLAIQKKSGGAYELGTWSNSYLRGTYSSTLSRDNLNEKNIELSGFDYFQTTFKNNKNQTHTVKSTTFEVSPEGMGNLNVEGVNTIISKSCDRAGNCTPDSNSATLKIDTIKPTCTTSGGNNENSWKGIGSTIKIVGTCKDQSPGTGFEASGCTEDTATISHEFGSTSNTESANIIKDGVGPGPTGGIGTVMDKAGNTAICEANQKVRLDYTKPTCSVSENTTWTKDNKTVSYKCKDERNGSKCASSPTTSNEEPGAGGYQKEWSSTKNTVRVKTFVAKDKAGNTRTCTAKTIEVKVDKTPPTVASKSMNSRARKVSATGDDVGSGVKNLRYMFKEGSSNPGAGNSHWSTSKTGPSNCGKTYNGFVKVTDNVGRTTIERIGSYTTGSCCSAENPTGCEWKTACREGNTKIYTSAAHNLEAGYVQHHLGGANDILYIIGETDSMYEVVPGSVANKYRYYPANNRVWIYKNCVGGSNSVCPYKTCPG